VCALFLNKWKSNGSKSDVFTREQAIEHLEYLNTIDKETSLDKLTENTLFWKLIYLNTQEWDLSTCSCFSWHKNLQCSHIISLASRLGLTSFVRNAYDTPIGPNNKAGRRKQTPFMIRDNEETVKKFIVDMCPKPSEAPT
jgi:hypothetical protein